MSDETKDLVDGIKTEKEMASISDADELRQRQAERTAKLEKEYNDIFQQLEEGEYLGHGYADDAVVIIPGPLFSSFINFVSAQMQTLHAVGSTIEILQNTNDAMITNLSEMTVRLMRQHKANVDAGATLTSEQMDIQDAKKHIKEVPQDEAKKKPSKAKGSKS
jgi:hypothetical protein